MYDCSAQTSNAICGTVLSTLDIYSINKSCCLLFVCFVELLKINEFENKRLKIKQNTAKIEADFQMNFDFGLGWTFFIVGKLVCLFNFVVSDTLHPTCFTTKSSKAWYTCALHPFSFDVTSLTACSPIDTGLRVTAAVVTCC